MARDCKVKVARQQPAQVICNSRGRSGHIAKDCRTSMNTKSKGENAKADATLYAAAPELLEANRIRYELWRDANQIEVLDDLHYATDPSRAELTAQIASESNSSNPWVEDKLEKASTTQDAGPLQPLVGSASPEDY